MAEIDIQEKRGQPMWVWIVGILALVVLVGVIWALTTRGDDRDDAMMQRDTMPAAPTAPTSRVDRADDAVLAALVFSETPVQAAPYR
jgi:hypothetical protein